jgi:hypothetical protein
MLLGYLFLNFELVKTAGAWEAYDKYNLLNKEIILMNCKKIMIKLFLRIKLKLLYNK